MKNELQIGVGEYQIEKAASAMASLFQVLSDGNWHRYSEIVEKTKMSNATVSKHLKQLKGIVKKKVDIECGEYPYPVYYMLPAGSKEFAEALSMYSQWRKKIIELMQLER